MEKTAFYMTIIIFGGGSLIASIWALSEVIGTAFWWAMGG